MTERFDLPAAPPGETFLPLLTVPPATHPKVLRDELVAAAEWVARYLSELPESRVTLPMPPRQRTRLREGRLDRRGGELGAVLDFVRDELAPYPSGNGHPAFAMERVSTALLSAGVRQNLGRCRLLLLIRRQQCGRTPPAALRSRYSPA